MEKEKRNKFLTILKEYGIITIGLLCYTLAWSIFILPNHLVGGGVSGLGAIVQYATGFNISYFYFLVNIVLLAIGMKVLGNKFGVKTIYAIIVTSVMFRILPSAIPQQFIQEVALNNGKLLCAIIAAVMISLVRDSLSRFMISFAAFLSG